MDFVSFDEAKERLGKSNEELQQMVDEGDLRVFRDGGELKFRKEDIDALAGGPAPGEEGEEESAGDTLMSIDADILFAEEEEQPADSAAETWIAADTEGVFPGEAGEVAGVEEAMAAPETEPAPLALSPETDESSLGAVLSDEELAADVGEPGEEPVIAVDAESGAASVVSGAPSAVAPSRTRIVTLVEPPAHHAQFTFMLGLAAAALALAGLALIALLAGAVPGLLESVASGNMPLILIIGGAVVVGIAAMVGYVLDKQRTAREAMTG
ncbi:MAG: hypothetical protein R6X20_15280 [Phycisphaerae bacterium]